MPKSRPKSRPMRREWRNMKELHNRDGCDGSAGEHRWTMKHCETPSRHMFGTLHDHYMIITWSLHDHYMMITWSLHDHYCTCCSCISFGYYIIWIICHVSYESFVTWSWQWLGERELAMTTPRQRGRNDLTLLIAWHVWHAHLDTSCIFWLYYVILCYPPLK